MTTCDWVLLSYTNELRWLVLHFSALITYCSNLYNIYKLYGRYKIRRLKLAPFVLTCHSFCTKKCIFLINVRLGSLERETTHKTIFAKYKYNSLSTEDGDWVWKKMYRSVQNKAAQVDAFYFDMSFVLCDKIYIFD